MADDEIPEIQKKESEEIDSPGDKPGSAGLIDSPRRYKLPESSNDNEPEIESEVESPRNHPDSPNSWNPETQDSSLNSWNPETQDSSPGYHPESPICYIMFPMFPMYSLTASPVLDLNLPYTSPASLDLNFLQMYPVYAPNTRHYNPSYEPVSETYLPDDEEQIISPGNAEPPSLKREQKVDLNEEEPRMDSHLNIKIAADEKIDNEIDEEKLERMKADIDATIEAAEDQLKRLRQKKELIDNRLNRNHKT